MCIYIYYIILLYYSTSNMLICIMHIFHIIYINTLLVFQPAKDTHNALNNLFMHLNNSPFIFLNNKHFMQD